MIEFKPEDRINNRYEVVRKLGAGAMGSVYLAHDLVENRIKVALKVLISETMEDQDLWAKGEYEALTRLRHPNLARVYDFGKIQGTHDYFIASEFIKGTDLFTATEYSNYEELCDIIVQVCRALEYIHSQGYVHFDIKPENILIARKKSATLKEGSKVVWEAEPGEEGDAYTKPNVKLIDFGLAEKITGSFDFAIKGTLNYLAPEMIDGGKPDRRADLYSLGVTLFQITNRDLPFYHDMSPGGRSLKRCELFEKHMKKLPDYLRKIILKLLEEKPEERFQSAKEVIENISEGSGTYYELETKETRSSYLHTTAMIGRQDELGKFKEFSRCVLPQLQADPSERLTAQNRPPLILTSGEIGSGKSRLLEEYRHFLRLNYVQVYAGNCYDGQNKAYQPFVEVLKQLAIYIGREHPLFKRYEDVLLRLLPEFKTGSYFERPLGLRPDQEKLYFIDRIVHFLIEAARDDPFVMFLNNLHWADEMTVELLGYFLQNLIEEDALNPSDPVNIVVVATLRTDENISPFLRELLSQLREENSCKEFVLHRFKRNRVKELICAMLHLTTIPAEFIDCIYQKTGGNPLFIVETLKSLQETGSIQSSESGWKIVVKKSWSEINLPTNVELALLSRFENLEPLGRDLIEILAVANRPVTTQFLEQLPRLSQAPITTHLHELKDKGFIASNTEHGNQFFNIDQPSFASIIYANIDPEKLKKLHLEFGQLLKQSYADHEDEVLEELVYHYRNSESRDLALDLALRAGKRLKGIYANEKAYDYYSYAAEILESKEIYNEQWVQCRESMGELCFMLGRYAEADRIYRQLLENEHLVKLSIVEKTRFIRSQGKTYEVQGDYDRALQCYKKANSLISQDNIEKEHSDRDSLYLEKIWTTSALGGLYVRMGKYDKAMKISIEALKIIESAHETIEHALVFSTIGRANYFKGNLPQAIEFHTRSLEIQEKLHNVPEKIMTLNNLGESYLSNAEYGMAFDTFTQAIELSEEVGDSYGRALSLNSLGWFHLFVGELEKAQEVQEQSLRLSRNYQLRRLNHSNYILSGLILQEKGELSKSEGNLFRALTALTKEGNRWELCRLLVRVSELHRLRGNGEEAGRMMEDADRLNQDLGIERLNFFCTLQKGKLLFDTEHYSDALDAFKVALKALSGDTNGELAAELYYEMGRTLLKLRRVDEVREVFQKSSEKIETVLATVPEQFKKAFRKKHAVWFENLDAGSGAAASDREAGAEGRQERDPSTDSNTSLPNKEETQRLALITQLMGEFAVSSDPAGCIWKSLVAVTRHFQGQYGFLLRIEGEESLRIVSSCNREGESLEEPASHLVEELILEVLNGGHALYCENTFDYENTNSLEKVLEQNLRSVIVAPLLTGQAVVGILYIANPSQHFSREELTTITSSFLPLFTLEITQCDAV